MLLAIAWSSVGFNLGDQVYTPVMKAIFNMHDPIGDLPKIKKPQLESALSWKEAYKIGKQLMTEQAKINGFIVRREESLQYLSDKGVFFYSVRSNRDLMDKYASTYLLFDGASGKFKGLSIPRGQNAGTTLGSWIFALHMAQIWGLPFRIFVTLIGILIATLSVTGIYIWLKKRNARQFSQDKRLRLEVELNA
jgi:hypothetical protein